MCPHATVLVAIVLLSLLLFLTWRISARIYHSFCRFKVDVGPCYVGVPTWKFFVMYLVYLYSRVCYFFGDVVLPYLDNLMAQLVESDLEEL